MTMNQREVDAVAERICHAHDDHRQLRPEELAQLPTPASYSEAYAIQDAVAQRRWLVGGGRTTAWKAGVHKGATEPYAAPIPPHTVVSSPAALPAAGFHMIGVESELAYRFSRDLPPREHPYSVAEIADAIAGVVVAIEVVDTRLEGWQQAGKWWQLADNQITGGLVLGSGLADWDGLVPASQQVELVVDGQLRSARQGSHPLQDPRPLLPWIVNHCAARSGGIRAGDLVTTGSWTGMEFVEPGAEVLVRFPGIGEARVAFPRLHV